MKKLILALLILGWTNSVFSQNTTNIYSVFVNVVNEPFRWPLIGFANVAFGGHKTPQIGFVNINTGDFKGLQTSFINTVGGKFNGAQVGFVNTTLSSFNGSQIGFVNTSSSFNGAQTGFVNIAYKEMTGAQISFVNIAARRTKGVQIGFVNYADSAENLIPIGFLSIVRHGGYQAIEYGFTEFHPVNIGYKIGVEKLYTTFSLSYNPFEGSSNKRFAYGLGLGSIIPLGASFFFNPELNSLNGIGKNPTSTLSAVPYFGYRLSGRMSVTVGPSVTWSHGDGIDVLQEPLFAISNNKIDSKNSIVVGARAGVRFRFK